MTAPFVARVEAALSFAFRGIHHVEHWDRRRCYGAPCTRIAVSIGGHHATFDDDVITRLVVAAHDQCVRVEFKTGGPRLITLSISDRKREGGTWERHPSMLEAIDRIRGTEAAK